MPCTAVVENMSCFYVKELEKKIQIFGGSRAEEMAGLVHAPQPKKKLMKWSCWDLPLLSSAASIERHR
jgi:hypothetical protein